MRQRVSTDREWATRQRTMKERRARKRPQVSIRELALERSSHLTQSGVAANTSTTIAANSKSNILLQRNKYAMGPALSKSTEIVKAENFKQESLDDSSFSIINLHGTSTAGGAIFVLLILGLACAGYAIKWYKDKRAKLRLRTATAMAVTA